MFPAQGEWSEGEYLALKTNRLVELSEGRLEFPPMPTEEHQRILAFLYRAVFAFVRPRGLGEVLFAPLRVRLWEGKIREPDLAFMLAEHANRRENRYWRGADLVMEIVSEDEPGRDWDIKRTEYAQAAIAEYWVVDPRDRSITVLELHEPDKADRVAGKYGPGQRAESVLLRGLMIAVDDVFNQRG